MKVERFSIQNYEEAIALWSKVGLSLGSSDTKEEVERMLKRNPDLFLVGKINNRIVAIVMGGFDGRRGYVHHLAVEPDYQRMGYGSTLMEQLIKRFMQKNVKKIHLFVEKRNKNVINFYKKLGWELRNNLVMMSLIPSKNK